MIRECLEEQVASWGHLGHPAIVERFVLRNGKQFTPGPRVGRQQRPHECFGNAAKFVLDTPSGRDDYVEGFFITPRLPIVIHHAWVRMWGHGSTAMDPTLEMAGSEYMGVVFDVPTLREQLLRNKVYGLLDHGHGINYELIFKLDPGLKPIVDEVIANRKRAVA